MEFKCVVGSLRPNGFLSFFLSRWNLPNRAGPNWSTIFQNQAQAQDDLGLINQVSVAVKQSATWFVSYLLIHPTHSKPDRLALDFLKKKKNRLALAYKFGAHFLLFKMNLDTHTHPDNVLSTLFAASNGIK